MLTNEQCIEVAEKVWGEDHSNPPFGPNIKRIRREIESWDGFGKTVEAMVGKWKDDSMMYEIKSLIDMGDNRFTDIAVREFISKTHLAALEALKDG